MADDKRLDETVEGGRYLVNGRLVNANGEPIKDAEPTGPEAEKPEADAKPKNGPTGANGKKDA